MYKENNKATRDQGQCPVGHQTKPRLNPISLRLQQLAVVCNTEKDLSISGSSHLCYSQTVCFWGARAVGCQMISRNLIWMSKILAQSFITVVNWVSQLCPECMLPVWEKFISIHMSQDNYLSTLCVWVTCMVHKSERQDDSYMGEPCHPFYKGGIYLQETILWGFHPSVLVITWFLLWYTARKDGGGLLLIEFLAKVSSIFSLFSLFLYSELYTIFQPTFIWI